MDSGTSSTSLIFVVIVIIIVVVFSTMSSTAINYPLLAYVLAVIIMMMTTFTSLYSSERVVAAVASFVLFILIFTFFGLRWFQYGLNSTGTYTGNYPPVINTCPDYLSVYKNGNQTVCIDTAGVALTTSTLRTVTRGSVPGPNNFFTAIYNSDSTSNQMNDMAAAANTAGLSWEGITDNKYKYWE